MERERKLPKISDSEYEIMKIIWKCKEVMAHEIIEEVDPKFNWSDKTIKTMINRLLKKQVIGYDKQGKYYVYYPVIKEEDYLKIESKSFVEKIFNGSLNAMFVSFLKETKLSGDEISELKKILEEKEE